MSDEQRVPEPDDVDAGPPAEGEGDAAAMSDDDIESLIASVGDAVHSVADEASVAAGAPAGKAPASGVAFALPSFDKDAHGLTGRQQQGMKLLEDVALDVRIELGRSRMFVEDVLRLGADCVIELDKAAGDPVDIYVNNRHVARGEVLVVNDNFCVRVSEIIRSGEDDQG